MQTQLEQVAKSYDDAIHWGRKGVDLYQRLPPSITSRPDYPLFQRMQAEDGLSDSGRPQIKAFLSPTAGLRFVDLGCCLNLMFRGYDRWPSTYYGVDISRKTIELLRRFVQREGLSIGGLYCGSMHKTPYATGFFDLGACIGSLEYFQRDFVELALLEARRILKPGGKFVLDIPDVGSPECTIYALIEAHLGRADQFDLTRDAFERLLEPYFTLESREKVGPMVQYFVRRKA
jgi:SAM-dependent methyltransferase